jgi:uncharacterized membrane protein (UPF0182 family)
MKFTARFRMGLLITFLLLVLFGTRFFVNLYTDWLWFKELGFTSIFSTRLLAQAMIVAGMFLLFFGIVWGNIRFALKSLPNPVRQDENVIYIDDMQKFHLGTSRLLLYITLFLAFITSLGGQAQWDTILPFLRGASFGVKDPVFQQDISFYVFTVPVMEFAANWLFSVIVFSMLGTLATYALSQTLSFFQGKISFHPNLIRHLSALLGALGLVIGFKFWLRGFDLLYTPHQSWFGAFYTDVNARLFAYRVMAGLSVVVAAFMFANIWRRKIFSPLFAIAVWLGASVILAGIYPALLQKFIVNPNELSKEAPYLENNIQYTNRAYGLDQVKESPFPVAENLSRDVISKNMPTIGNIRLWDHRPLKETYKQIQVIRQYYDFLDVDIDRYKVGNEYVQVMLSPREITVPPSARTWTNEKMVYTHGYGLAMTRVNAVEKEGLPKLLVKDIPPVSPYGLNISRPEIYFGESQSDYILVKTREKEFDYPKGNENVYTTYSGKAGIPIGSFFRRLIFAYRFGSTDLLFTSRLTPNTRLLYRRNITERLGTLFPFLRLDDDPYMIIASDGKLFWLVDGYTLTNRYPYSKPLGNRFNYIRNSVKIAIDAYDGTVNAYITDPDDPLIQTWARVFPGVFKNADQIPADFRAHFRYPEQLFRAQAYIYAQYHMKDIQVFYNQEDKWAIPSETFDNQTQDVEPYFVIMRLPGEAKEEFMLMIPFTPASKTNMIAWMAAKCDPEDYGKLVVYQFPKDKLVYGPQQIEARIDQDPVISPQLSLWNQQGSRVFRGNLLVIPIEDSLLYVEPVYLKSEQSQIPELKRIIVAYDEKIAMESSMEDALLSIFGGKALPQGQELEPSADKAETGTAATDQPASSVTLKTLARQASQSYQKAQERMKAGDWAGYGQEMNKLKDTLRQMEQTDR